MDRPALLLVLMLALAAACAPARSTAAAPSDQAWTARTGVAPVAFVGLPLRIILEQSPVSGSASAPAQPIAISSRCTSCAQPRVVRGTATPPDPADATRAPGHELVIVGLAFPEAGEWTIDPFGAVITVRDPARAQDPLVQLRPSSSLPVGCDASVIASALRGFGDAARAAQTDGLARSLAPDVDFSDSGTTLPKFATRDRATAIAYILDRQRAGERLYPLSASVSTGSAAGTVDLFVATMRSGSDLGPGAADGAYVSVVGSALRCNDRTIARWNSDLLKLDPRAN